METFRFDRDALWELPVATVYKEKGSDKIFVFLDGKHLDTAVAYNIFDTNDGSDLPLEFTVTIRMCPENLKFHIVDTEGLIIKE